MIFFLHALSAKIYGPANEIRDRLVTYLKKRWNLSKQCSECIRICTLEICNHLPVQIHTTYPCLLLDLVSRPSVRDQMRCCLTEVDLYRGLATTYERRQVDTRTVIYTSIGGFCSTPPKICLADKTNALTRIQQLKAGMEYLCLMTTTTRRYV